jgi:glyoxylase-like metal-dependent hydrolase (beta-lactamase superfamily II)
VKKLLEGVWSWSVWKAGAFKGVAFNGTYLELGDERVVIDPPPLTSWDLDHMRALGAPTRVVVTNVNHLRASDEVCATFDATLHVPAADAEALAHPEAETYADGDVLFGLRVLTLAHQKSPGESVLYSSERKLLLVGDALIGTPRGSLCMLPDAKFSDVGAARRELGRLRELELEALIMGDGDSILSGGSAAIEAFLAG